VVERYSTLRGLWEAFKGAERRERIMGSGKVEGRELNTANKRGKGRPKKSRVERAESMLKVLGKGRRRIAKELSAKINRLFTDDLDDLPA
jgi:hypothetical protein